MNWSEEEFILLRKYYESGMSYLAISHKLFRSVDAIRMMLIKKDYYFAGRKREFNKIDMILNEVSLNSGLKPKIILSKTRKREVVQSRQLCHYLTKEFTRISPAMIGFKVGEKDRATVLHGIKTIQNLRDTDKLFEYKYQIIFKQISNRIRNKNLHSFDKIREKEKLTLIKSSLNNIHLKIELNDLINNIRNEKRIS